MSPSVARVRRSGTIARRNARPRAVVRTSSVSPPILSSFARQYGRYGYRKVAALLRQPGGIINDKRVERKWQREGLKVPHKQPKRSRLWLADRSSIRLRPKQRTFHLDHSAGETNRVLDVALEMTRASPTLSFRSIEVPGTWNPYSTIQSIWRQRAEEARTIADQLSDPESKRMILRLAENYLRMAEHATRRASQNERGARRP